MATGTNDYGIPEGELYATDGASFEVDLRGYGSRVKMNGVELPGVRDVKVHASLDGTTVTIEFKASEVTGLRD